MSYPEKRKFSDTGSNPAHSGKKKFRDNAEAVTDVLTAAPRELKILNYVQAHVSEIEYLNKAIERDMNGKTSAQRLPRQMQRRAMGHDIKRMPRSVRGFARAQYKDQGEKKKAPSRHHRRRPRHLLQEYVRRQRKHSWLETHIWHAKRFHMVEKWGFKIPWKPTAKSERACYRATSRYCLLQDLSYLCCIEITGDQDAILTSLARVTSTNTGSTFAAKSCLSGTREGHTQLYKCDSYPYGAIGPVTFTWKPLTLTHNSTVSMATHARQIWIWCHPSCFHEIWKEFVKCQDMIEAPDKTSEIAVEKMTDLTDAITSETGNEKTTNVDGNSTELPAASRKESTDSKKSDITDSQKSVNEINDKVLKTKAKRDESENKGKTGKFIDTAFNGSAVNAKRHLTMKSLTGSVLRFSLTGPQSSSVLFDALQQASTLPETALDQSKVWWKHHYKESEAALAHKAQWEVTEKIKECHSPAELPPHCVVGLTVRDPRLVRPEQRIKVKSQATEISGDVSVCQEKMTPAISSSPLWEVEIRRQVAETKMSDYNMNVKKSDNLVPGTPLSLGDEESRVPVILIQRPGSATTSTSGSPCRGKGSGWDVLLPRGWAMPFWLSLVFRGARCGGMKETESMAFENRTLVFPNEFPDTPAGRKEIELLESSAMAKFNRRPPAKRPNFAKLGVVSPFSCPWKWLVNEWNGSGKDGASVQTEEYYVLRDSKVLRRLQNVGEASSPTLCNLLRTTGAGRILSGRAKDQLAKFQETLNNLQTQHNRALIAVSVDMIQRGAAGQFSMVCIPSEDDLVKLEQNKDYGGPLEPKQIDPLEVEKKKMKNEMKEKKIKKKKVKVDRRLTVVAERTDVRVRNCSRDVIGYLTSGGFSLGCGNGAGKGFVSALGLVELLTRPGFAEKHKGIVLVRSTTSLQYRFGRFTVL